MDLHLGRWGPSIPTEIVTRLFEEASIVKDVIPREDADNIVIQKQLPVTVGSSKLSRSCLIIHTVPMTRPLLARLRQLQVQIESSGSPETWTSFEVAILRPKGDQNLGQEMPQPLGIPFGYVIATKPTDPTHQLMWRSHRNLSPRFPVFIPGQVFTYDHPLWIHLTEGDLIGVQACVRSSSAKNHVSRATLVFWERYDFTVGG